ncbi:Apocytochrome f [Apostasia shenzhenica]|uniref:Cytochrome f n=1 Tax=Apostasia shenzhenica TaxID=1088818 RepID=A0A2I0A958_9ASPA|nr:Apocytochrome f [Apostasia shenzhenica]
MEKTQSGNRGRGQIYPDGSKSNNTVYNATAAGIVSKIVRKEKRGYEITIVDASDGRQVVDIIPPGPFQKGKNLKTPLFYITKHILDLELCQSRWKCSKWW